MKSLENSEICEFASPLAEHNIDSSPNGIIPIGDAIRLNLVHPKTNKSTILNFHPKLLQYQLDEKNFEHQPSPHDIGCDCMKEVVKETQNSGTIMQFLTEAQCLQEDHIKNMIDAKNDELEKHYLKNPFESCEMDAAKQFGVFYEEENCSLGEKFLDINRYEKELNNEYYEKYQSLVDKYFGNNPNEEVDFKYYEEYLSLVDQYFSPNPNEQVNNELCEEYQSKVDKYFGANPNEEVDNEYYEENQ